jgi:hypothetical protein
MTKYIHTSPVTDWFFIHAEPLTVYRLALWATRDDGTITGLIAVSAPVETSGYAGETTARLAEPPPVPGNYKHLSSLNADEKTLITTF